MNQSDTRSFMGEFSKQSTIFSIVVLAITRLFSNMTRRFHYPFLPEISRELGVSLASVQSVVASQAGIGITSPFFGTFSERYGRKRVMLFALFVMSLASVPGILSPHSFGIFYAVVVIWGVAKIIFDPALLAYVADRIHYRRRGMALGFTELAWAGSLIIAAPLTGYLLGLSGLRLVYAMILVANALGFGLVLLLVQSDYPEKTTRQRPSPLTWWRVLVENPHAIGALAFTIILVGANEILYIVYGEWMETQFDLALTALGTVTITIAAAEVIGELIVIGTGDRFGKRRMAVTATLLSSLGYILLPVLGFSLPVAMIGIFCIYVAVETAIVSSIPIFSEILPNARGIMLSSNLAAHSIGRFAGAFMGSFVYGVAGFGGVGVAAMVSGLIAFGLLLVFVQEANPD